jgi:hypothetical protein
MVGDAIASKLIALGHEVMIARSAIRMQLLGRSVGPGWSFLWMRLGSVG